MCSGHLNLVNLLHAALSKNNVTLIALNQSRVYCILIIAQVIDNI